MNKSIKVIVSLLILCGVFFVCALIGKGAEMESITLGLFCIITSNGMALWLGYSFIGKEQ